jgi:hypothetical protein
MLNNFVEYIKNLLPDKPGQLIAEEERLPLTTNDINIAIDYAISVANSVPNMSLRSSVVFQLEKAKEFAKII